MKFYRFTFLGTFSDNINISKLTTNITFLFRSEPSKVDVDVLRVLDGIDLDYARYPNINIWKEDMEKFNEEHLSR
jgi:hypothetical protein